MMVRKIFLISIFNITLLYGLLMFATPAEAQGLVPREVSSLKWFGEMAVLEEGRIKPLDTYARNLLLRFSGKSSYNRQPAIHWLARFMFAPETTSEDKIFLINNPELLTALGAEPDKKRRYSFAQLEPGYPKLFELARIADTIEAKNRSAVEEEILRVFQNIRLYAELSHVFKFAFPHPDFNVTYQSLKSELQLTPGQRQFSFYDIASRADLIRVTTDALNKRDAKSWTEKEQEVVRLVSNLYQWSLLYTNLPFRIVPSISGEEETWYSPWDSIRNQFHSPVVKTEMAALNSLIVSYWNGEQLEFDIAARAFNGSVKKRIVPKAKRSIDLIPLEVLYNKLNLFLIAKIFYSFAFFVFLFLLTSTEEKKRQIAFWLVVLGFIPHTIALLTRIIIMARPPVSSLYETFIFVAFVSVLIGILIERINKKWLGIMVSSICGFVFLIIAGKFSAEGDTMKMLVAVLNSNFWLGTHVLSITTGYAGCCVAGVIGHIYILQALTKPKDKKLLESTYRNLLGALGFGLTMTFLGTNLGGIWADQSWGRFWGWDPKENGALLIILWTAIIFHAKIGNIIKPLGVAVGSALGIIVVMWAWFGVNLLSVGLHSYGFTSGIAYGLVAYVVCQILFLAVTVPMIKRKMAV